MRTRRVVLLLAAASAAASGAVIAKRRLDTIKATGSLHADPDLSGAPLGVSMRRPDAPPTGDARVHGPQWEPDALAWLAGWVPDAPRKPWTRALAYVWAAPITLVGVALGLASGAAPQWREGVLLFSDLRGPAGALLQARGFQATAMGHAILSLQQPDERLMAHELAHVRHAERLGLFSALLYGLLYPLYGYARHPMERAARSAARRQQGLNA